jgi:hypothetical protein
MPVNSIIIMAALAAAPSMDDGVRTAYDGRAVDRKTGTHLYTERHEEIMVDGKRVGLRSDYIGHDGRTWATRVVDFSKDAFAPDLRFEDLRTGSVLRSEKRGDSVHFTSRDGRTSPPETQSLLIPEPAVIDAGFNNFVQHHWDVLASGRRLSFYFGAPFDMDYYRFRVSRTGERQEGDRRFMVVTLEIDDFVLRLFLEPIVLTYDMSARRLVSYEGISNLQNEQGTSFDVRITYDPYGP